MLALILGEQGADRVDNVLAHSVMSAVNLHEVYKKLGENGIPAGKIKSVVDEISLMIIAHDADAAWHASLLSTATRQYGSGLGDRACLSLAQQRNAVALTADREWARIRLDGIQIELIR